MKQFILFIVLVFHTLIAFSQMHVGGEISWECTPNGNYRFTLIQYHRCEIGCGFPLQKDIQSTAPGFSSIQLTKVLEEEFSPECYLPVNPINCSTATSNTLGAFKRHIYTSDNSFPSGVPLTGTPPPGGWLFYYFSCCNIPVTNISNFQSYNSIVMAKMHPYQNGIVNSCLDNSPAFEEKPVPVFCSDYPISFGNAAFDKDMDSLSYKWDYLYHTTINQIIAYNPGYDYDNPFGVSTSLDPVSGLVTIPNVDSLNLGRYQFAIRVESWRDSVLVSEVTRSYFMEADNCGVSNSRPVLIPPFSGPAGPNSTWKDTAMAGEVISFTVGVTDFDTLPNSNPQTVLVEAFSSQLDSTANGLPCANPPCATISPSQAVSGAFGVTQTINWQTGCQHLQDGDLPHQHFYNFTFNAQDDYCPIPGYNQKTVTLLLTDKPLIPSPDQVSAVYDTVFNNVQISWNQVTDSMNSFSHYELWRASDPSLPFVLIDSFPAITITNYTDTTVGTDDTLYYFVVSRSGCFNDQYSLPQDTIAVKLPNTSAVSEIVEDAIELKIYPNPTVEVFNLESSAFISAVLIFNPQGQLIKKEYLPKQCFKAGFDLSGEAAGQYIVMIITSEGKKYTSKLFLVD